MYRYCSAVWLAAVGMALLPASAGAQTPPPAPPPVQETVEVIAVTPLEGVGVPRDRIPSNVQVLTADDLARGGAGWFGEGLLANVAGLAVNEAQGNPFQPDVQFRGFSVSPLLGLPQGLAVYMDGVRVNEPFGDTVNWDLLPMNALAGVTLLPGSSPLFGLNALGGAISLDTKTGFTHPGHEVQVSAGSFLRRTLDVQSGGHSDRLSYFLSARLLAEDGWRDFSPSRIVQAFANVEWRGDTSTVTASVTGGANRLIGNGVSPVELLAIDRRAIFTHPDETRTSLGQVILRARRTARPDLVLDAVGYVRPASIRTLNGDDTSYDECEDEAFEELMCAEDGDGPPVVDQFGNFVDADDENELDATLNTSRTRSTGWGGSVQANLSRPLFDRSNQFIVGAAFDRAGARYEADTEIGRLTADRGAEGIGLLDVDAAVRLRSTSTHAGLFAANFFTPMPELTVSVSARYAHSTIRLRDGLGTALDGDHSFNRVNGSLGLTYAAAPAVDLFGSLSTASRVPTASELGCADPEDPCRLPNAFVADPPLNQVVAHTIEGGVRGGSGDVTWSATAFRTTNHDDIIFISSGALTNAGHFENIGDTRRQGIELMAAGRAGANLRWSGSYALLHATFLDPLTLSSPNHPDEVDGEIEVEPGSDLPSLPRHTFKAALAAGIGSTTLSGELLAFSSQWMRGDEANLLDQVAGRAVVNVRLAQTINDQIEAFVRVTSLLGSEGSTFGLLGEPDEVLGDEFENPQFLSPEAPRAAWVGLTVRLP